MLVLSCGRDERYRRTEGRDPDFTGSYRAVGGRKCELRTQLAQNSSNSHKPPASDGYTKKPLIKPALPKVTAKKAGGQPGHPGQTLKMVEQPVSIGPQSHPLQSMWPYAYGRRPVGDPSAGLRSA